MRVLFCIVEAVKEDMILAPHHPADDDKQRIGVEFGVLDHDVSMFCSSEFLLLVWKVTFQDRGDCGY